MSTVNYSLKHKGVRLISADEAWAKNKSRRIRYRYDIPLFRLVKVCKAVSKKRTNNRHTKK